MGSRRPEWRLTKKRTQSVLGGVMFLALISVCGAGIDGTGVVNRVGSIVQNGVVFETNAATIFVDGKPGTEADVRAGQIVRVQAESPGQADLVEIEYSLRGEVTSVNQAATEFEIFNRTVRFDGRCVLDGLETDELVPGASVTVNGLVDDNGDLVAGWVAPAAANDFLLRGDVTAITLETGQATISGQSVDISNAVVDGFPGGMLGVGDRVLVRGSSVSSGVLLADTVSNARPQPAHLGDIAALEAFVTKKISPNKLVLGDITVRLQPSTVIEGGTSSSLVQGARVIAQGTYASPHVLVASSIVLKPNADQLAVGTVDSINAAEGTLVVSGVQARTDAFTIMVDDSALDIRRFDLSDLSIGDSVEMTGVSNPATGELEGALLRRVDAGAGNNDDDSDEDSDE